MSRKFIQSGKFNRIVSADLSRTMLAETRSRIVSEKLPLPELVRCDSARLPFKDGSFDAIHAGAAMHCWPRLDMSLREIYRVLKPGGVFYTTTILTDNSQTTLPFNVFPSVEYLLNLFEDAGWSKAGGKAVGRREGRGCAVIKAAKGGAYGGPDSDAELLLKYERVKLVNCTKLNMFHN
jgi:ubiquinone/menaquinone biosynthesis C-methylase UbiE